MAVPVSYLSLKYNDNTLNPKTGQPESASFQVPITTITPANQAAVEADINTLETAIDAIVIGVLADEDVVLSRETISSLRAASKLAQRENKWLVRYIDSSTQDKFRVSIPTADLLQLPDGAEFLDLTAGVGLAFKNAFEAVVVSPRDDATAVTVVSVQFVGRNS